MSGGPGNGLRQHPALHVEDAGRDVAGLARRGGEGGAHQGLGLLLDHREQPVPLDLQVDLVERGAIGGRSEEHTSELQSLMRISYAVFCLKKKKNKQAIDESNTSILKRQ